MIIYKKSSRPFFKTRFAHISDQRSSGWSEPTLTNRPASSVVDKKHPDPLMGRGYLNVRATGGAVASSPYRGRPWRGWMLLCFFLRAEEKRGLGVSPGRVRPCKKKTFFTKKRINSRSRQSAGSTIYPILRKPNYSTYTPEQSPSFSGPSPYHYNAWKSPPTHPPAG